MATQLILTAIGATGIVSGVGSQIILQSMSLTASGITTGIKSLFESKNTKAKGLYEIKRFLQTLDLNADIEVIKSCFNDVTIKKEAVLKGWENLNKVLSSLLLKIEEINKKIKFVENTTKLGRWWYGVPDFTENYEELQALIAIFNRRYDVLCKIMN